MQSQQGKSLLKVLLSIFILAHLAVIVILANGTSYLGRSLQHYLIPYANTLGLNSSWNFFSPDPINTFYIRYVVNFEDGREALEGFLPRQKDQVILDSGEKRYMYAARVLGFDERRLQTLMGPYYCRKHPGAQEVTIQAVVRPIPALDTAIMNPHAAQEEVKYINRTYDCTRPGDEVDL